MSTPSMNFVVKVDERPVAKFWLPTDANFFAEALSEMINKPVVVESANQRATYGKRSIHIEGKVA